jgi:hypothetical protein
MAEKLTVYTLDEVAERLARYAQEARIKCRAARFDSYYQGGAHAFEVAHAEITALVDCARRNAADDIESGNVWPVEV